VFVPGKPFQPSLMFAGKAEPTQVKKLLGAPLLALPANIRLGWKGLPGTNTLAYYGNLKITAAKSFIIQAPVGWFHDCHRHLSI
jgi:hypothetical protein